MIKGIGTHIKVADFEASRKFYEALGFEKSFEMGPKIPFKKDATGNLISVPEDYQAIDFVYGGCKLEIADGHRAVKPEVFKEKVTSSKISLMIPVDSLEDIIDRCKNNGIELAVGPRHYYWGTLELVVKDPDGVVLVFIQPYDEETAKKLNADESFGKVPAS